MYSGYRAKVMAASRACYHEKQYIFNSTTGAVISQRGVALLT